MISCSCSGTAAIETAVRKGKGYCDRFYDLPGEPTYESSSMARWLLPRGGLRVRAVDVLEAGRDKGCNTEAENTQAAGSVHGG